MRIWYQSFTVLEDLPPYAERIRSHAKHVLQPVLDTGHVGPGPEHRCHHRFSCPSLCGSHFLQRLRAELGHLGQELNSCVIECHVWPS